MFTEVEELLKPIVEALNKGDYAAGDLWAILTALRGSDNGSEELKMKPQFLMRPYLPRLSLKQIILTISITSLGISRWL